MPTLIDIQAFLATARGGSFSAAAREIGIAPSVVTKRVSRLEHEIGSPLFIRSTRSLVMTAEAERLRPRLQLLVSELQDTLKGVQTPRRGIRGHLRVKLPTTVGALYVGPSIARFQAANPSVTTELLLMDRSVNPLEEGFEIAVGALPQSYNSVDEVPLCPYRRVLVASPDYLDRHGKPKTPGDIVDHSCLAFVPVGLTWTFESASGSIAIEIHTVFTVNDSHLLMAGAEQGIGLAVIPEFLARTALAEGRLVSLMPDFPIEPLWLKALVPRNKARRPEVAALVAHLREEFSFPPWDVRD